MRTILSVLLAVLVAIMSISMAVPATTAVGDMDPVITADTVVAQPGDTVAVNLTIKNNPGILGMTLKVTYDESKLTLTGVANGNTMSYMTFTTPKDLSSGCHLPWDAIDVPVDGVKDGVIATLSFQVSEGVAENEEIKIDISYDAGAIIDNDLNPLNIDMIDGKICVGDSSGGATDDSTSNSVIIAETVSAQPGDTVAVDLTIENNPGILGMTLKVTYDESKATLTGVANGDTLSYMTFTTPKNLSSGCQLPWDAIDVPVDGVKDGVIATLTFQVSENVAEGEEIEIGISYDAGAVIDNDLNPLNIGIKNGKIIVGVEAEDTEEFMVRGTGSSIVAGTDVSVDIVLENNPGFCTIDLCYVFNTDYFTLTAVENKVPGFTMTHITTTIWDAVSDFTEDATLGTLHFSVAEDTPVGEHEIEIIFLSAKNDAFGDVIAKTAAAIVTVIEKGCGHEARTEVPYRPAECVTPGNYQHFICDDCGAVFKADGVTETTVEQEVIPAKGHTWSEPVVTEPNCTGEGYTTHTCAVCGDTSIDAYTEALGHEWKGTGCTRCDATRENPFADVPENAFYIDPVLWAVENGITNGTSATTFGPADQCMRAHVVTFLWRAVGSPEPKLTVNPFVDVKSTDFYYKPVLWALENGITSGMDATHFGPTAYCNRAQVVTFLYRTMGSPDVGAATNPFTDVAAGSFYEKPVLWAVENGVTAGLSATSFGPNSICNRAQIVTFLYRAFVND